MIPAPTAAPAPSQQASDAISVPVRHMTRPRGMSSPALLSRSMHPQAPARLTEADIDRLLDDLKAVGPNTDQVPSITNTARPLENMTRPLTDSAGDDIEHLLDELFESQLAAVAKARDERALLAGLAAALRMLPNLSPSSSKGGAERLAAALRNTSGGRASVQVANQIIDIFVAAQQGASEEAGAEASEGFIDTLFDAIARFAMPARCNLTVHLLWAAKKLDCYSMASQVTERFTAHLVHEDHTVTCERLLHAARYLGVMPIRYRLMMANCLYRCAPEDSVLRLVSLQAIASHSESLTDVAGGGAFCAALNQRIYELRIAAESQIMRQAETAT